MVDPFQGPAAAMPASAPLPSVVHSITNPAVIDRPNARHEVCTERRQLRCSRVLQSLPAVLRSGDGAGDCVEHQNPPEGELGECRPGGDEGPQLLHDVEAGPEPDSGKGLAYVESFPAGVE